jgi:TonB family protein
MNSIKAGTILALFALALCTPPATQANPQRVPDGRAVWQSEVRFKEVRNGWDHLAQGELIAAERLFVRVEHRTRSNYERSHALLGLAQVRLEQADTPAAIKMYETVIELNHLTDKTHFVVLLKLAEHYHAQGRFNEAWKAIDQWQSKNPDANSHLGDISTLRVSLVPVFRKNPPYPKKAIYGRIEGEVTVRAMVNAEGAVVDAKIMEAKPEGVFDHAVLATIRDWRFIVAPGRNIEITQTFEFSLLN